MTKLGQALEAVFARGKAEGYREAINDIASHLGVLVRPPPTVPRPRKRKTRKIARKRR